MTLGDKVEDKCIRCNIYTLATKERKVGMTLNFSAVGRGRGD